MTDNGQEALTPKQIARLLGTNARTVRKFLRNELGKVGQGNRWEIENGDLATLNEAWRAWRDPIEERAKKHKEALIEEPVIDPMTHEEEMEV